MRNRLTILFVFLSLLTSAQFVSFKKQTLYDVYEEPPEQERVEPVIYDDAVGTMWNSLESCGDFEVVNELFYSGNNCLKISWDKNKGCDWIGFGNSFSNWRPVDMSELRMKQALSLYIRTQSDIAKSVPIVAAMEDAGGGGSYHFIDAKKYLYGLQIDTTWKRLIVPLWDFPIRADEVDIYSIRQMQFQLEGAGAYFLDDIRLIDYTKEEFAEMREEVELMKPKGKSNQIVYSKGEFLEDAWGYKNNKCQVLEEINQNGDTVIHWKYDANACSWANWGINWNGWYQINLRGTEDISQINFNVKTVEGASFKIFLEDFSGHSVELYTSNTEKFSSNEWSLINIPFSELDFKSKGFVVDQVRQISFKGIGSGEVYIDEIKIVEK